jgi:hypothetical protein
LRLTVPLLVAAVSAVAALIALGAAAYPRGTRKTSAYGYSIVYFSDVARVRDQAHLRSAIRETIDASEDAVLDQLMQLSQIAARKYLYIKISFLFFAMLLAGAVACVLEVLYGR